MARFRSAYTKADFNMPATTAVNSTGFTKIGECVIKSGENVFMGYGAGGQESAEGRIYAELKNATPVEVKGVLRIVAVSPQDLQLGGGVWFEARTEALNTSATDRTKQIPFNEMLQGLSKDNKYQLFFKSDSATETITAANCTILMDITKDLR